MVLVMTEVADLEAQGLIKKLDAAYTWPHPIDKGYSVSAVFVRTDDNRPYLIYCPKTSSNIAISEEQYNSSIFWGDEPLQTIRRLDLSQSMSSVNGVHFLIIPLEEIEPKKVKKTEVEKMFDIKVVE